MSLVLGGLRTRSILSGSVLGGDNLDGGADELPVTTMGAISSILGATKPMRSPCCFSLSLSSIFLRCNSFEGKIKPKMVLHPSSLILQSTQKTNYV